MHFLSLLFSRPCFPFDTFTRQFGQFEIFDEVFDNFIYLGMSYFLSFVFSPFWEFYLSIWRLTIWRICQFEEFDKEFDNFIILGFCLFSLRCFLSLVFSPFFSVIYFSLTGFSPLFFLSFFSIPCFFSALVSLPFFLSLVFVSLPSFFYPLFLSHLFPHPCFSLSCFLFLVLLISLLFNFSFVLETSDTYIIYVCTATILLCNADVSGTT